MRLPPNIERILVGAALGAGLGSGHAGEIGPKLLIEFLKPVTKSMKAIEFLARTMYERDQKREGGAIDWQGLPATTRRVWMDRATAALEGITHLVAQGFAGSAKAVASRIRRGSGL